MTAIYTEEKQYKAIPKAGQGVPHGSRNFTFPKSDTFNITLKFVDFYDMFQINFRPAKTLFI